MLQVAWIKIYKTWGFALIGIACILHGSLLPKILHCKKYTKNIKKVDRLKPYRDISFFF